MRTTRAGAPPAASGTRLAVTPEDSRAPQRRRLPLTCAAALTTTVALSGCQWTSTVQTDQPYDPADGTSVQVGGLELDNVLVVSNGNGQPGSVSALAINHTNAPVQLTMRPANASSVNVLPVTVPARGSLALAAPERPGMVLPAVSEPAGAYVQLNLTSSQGETTVNAPVLPPAGHYQRYAPAGTVITPSPAATPSPGATQTQAPSAGPAS